MASTQEDGQTFGAVPDGAAAIAAFNAEIDAQQRLRKRFAKEHPREWARYCRRKGYVDAPERGDPKPPIRAPQGHAPRAASNEHRRGSRRGERSTSSSSDDPGGGESDPDDDARLCFCGCGHPARPNSLYATDPGCRVRAYRQRQAERDQVRDIPEPDLSLATAPCDCIDCRRARNGVYDVDPEVIQLLREHREEVSNPSRPIPRRPPRLSDGRRHKRRDYFISVTAETPFPFPIQTTATPVESGPQKEGAR